MSDPLELVDRLGAAHLSQDVAGVLACFIPDDDITYVGSGAGESATGREQVRKLLDVLFDGPAPCGWQATAATVHTIPGGAFVIADADGSCPCRITGLLSRRASGLWLWRAVQVAALRQPD